MIKATTIIKKIMFVRIKLFTLNNTSLVCVKLLIFFYFTEISLFFKNNY